MTLDVVVPTYNRSSLLHKTIDSLLMANVPIGLEVAIIIVDNNNRFIVTSFAQEIFHFTGQFRVKYSHTLRPRLARSTEVIFDCHQTFSLAVLEHSDEGALCVRGF